MLTFVQLDDWIAVYDDADGGRKRREGHSFGLDEILTLAGATRGEDYRILAFDGTDFDAKCSENGHVPDNIADVPIEQAH
jgi:hypothetical protein